MYPVAIIFPTHSIQVAMNSEELSWFVTNYHKPRAEWYESVANIIWHDTEWQLICTMILSLSLFAPEHRVQYHAPTNWYDTSQ